MKIFIAYGYNERDKWIKDLVFPLVNAFGSEIETGEETYDGTIPQVVRIKIERSDALIGFTTKREPLNPASTLTHRWVIEELAAAIALDKKFVEVREIGVDRVEKTSCQQRQIGFPVSKRGQFDLDHGKAEKEVFAKIALFHSLCQIFNRSGDDAYIDLDRPGIADSPHFFLLQSS